MLYTSITMQFQGLFTRIAPYFSPFTHVTVRYRSRGVFRVGGYCPPGSRGISNPRYSGVLLRLWKLRLRDYHPLWCGFPEVFDFFTQSILEVPNTTFPYHHWQDSVCPVPISLAVTKGIAVAFFSTAYYDVSVQRVALPYGMTPPIRCCREVPLGDPRVSAYMRLTAAYRSLSRPSSAPVPRHPLHGVVACWFTESSPLSPSFRIRTID